MGGSFLGGDLDSALERFASGEISRKEVESTTGLWFSDILVEMSKRGLKLPRVDSTLLMSPQQKQLLGKALSGFIHDDLAAQKNRRRSEFANLVAQGLANSLDASMFHGVASQSKVRYLSDEY